MIKEANVTVIISDMERAVKFYVETLGLELKSRYGEHFAQIQAPGMIIAFHPASKQGPQPGREGSMSIGFSVDNLESAIQDLVAKGVKFTGIVDDGQVRLAFFGDPDNNHLYLSQSRWG